MRLLVVLLVGCGLAMALLGTRTRAAVPSHDWRLSPEEAGRSADALKLPERASYTQVSRGWQFLSVPLPRPGEQGVLAASDGVYWSFELRALVKKDSAASALIGLVFRYENPGSYGALLWDTRTGELTLRGLRQKRSTNVARGKAAFGRRAWASLVMRVVTGELTCYVNGEKVLTGSESSLLGRVAVFAVGGGALQLDGVEARSLDPTQADADVFGRSRSEFETKCATCHELDGPWNSQFAPDDWESDVKEMLVSEGASQFISRTEANRITDYLRIISLHPDRAHYQRRAEQR
jgi:mono/diheme cytochrome c family protein